MGGLSVLVLVGILSAMFYLFLAAFLFIVIYLLITYLFESMTLFHICKNRRDSVVFFAFLPSYQKYLLGEIAKKRVLGIILMGVDILAIGLCVYFYCSRMFVTWIFLLLLVLLCVSFILNTVIAHRILKITNTRYADIFTVFSVLSLGLLRPVFLFLVRKRPELNT